MNSFLRKLTWWWHRRQKDAELEEELQFHLDEEAEERRERGLPPDEAKREAHLDVGNILLLKEDTRTSWTWTFWEQVGIDFRQAMRAIRHNKVWAATAVLTLALGMAPFTGMLTLINRVYAPLPVTQPDELVFGTTSRAPGAYAFIRDHNSTLSGLLAYDYEMCGGVARPEVVSSAGAGPAAVEFISGNYYSVLGVPAVRGRTIQPEDDRAASSPVAMISEPYWERVFGRNPNAVGRTLEIDRKVFTIVGIWPTSFLNAEDSVSRSDGKAARTDIMIPLVHDSRRYCLEIVGRRKPGVTVAQVHADIGNLRLPDDAQPLAWKLSERPSGLRAIVADFRKYASGMTLSTILIIGFFGAPLFLCCTNIATFLASRAEDRQVEIAMRLALGASRGRLVRQLLLESLVLAGLAGIVGTVLSYWWTRIISNPPFTDYGNLPMNWNAFGLAALLVLPVTVACGLLPATGVTQSAAEMLRTFSSHFTRSRSPKTRMLIAIQVGVSFFGLCCAGLMFRGAQTLHTDEVGYNIDNVATFTVNPSDKTPVRAMFENIVSTVSRVPGVVSVSFSDQDISGPQPTSKLYARDAAGTIQGQDAVSMSVDPRFFKTMGLTFALGGPFSEPLPEQGVVINESLARALFPGQSPLGRRFGRAPGNLEAFEIVGVIKDDKPAPAQFAIYTHDVCCSTPKTFEVRVAGGVAGLLQPIQAAVREVAPNLSISHIRVPRDILETNYVKNDRPWRLGLTYYAGLGTILVITGVFSLMSHSVARRTREIGIRMAIGAQPRQVLKGVLLESLKMVVPGAIIGLAGTLVVNRLFLSFSDAIPAVDLPALTAATVAMFAIASLAGYVPARRASRVEPIIALRHE